MLLIKLYFKATLALIIDNTIFKKAICKTLVEEMYEYIGKLRNIEIQGPETFLPTLAIKIATAGAV
ncbi:MULTISPECIES: kanamycin nucleotidyltransferase C-terminal domain-containing protein [Bacillus]|uniref:kanamycin nucleotidyltransferase C-terminal domain-containing protein n=1 Tax=unclassified Bacillus (in: firmicutes) TaxID=185979 RepID=UPI001E51C453|nr:MULTISPECIES: kanamycin nucleotidyltransferase C-terminal domain-containing protein [Bacillus]